MKVHEQVKLSEIRPNPFRQLDTYPLDKLKIEKLRSSMKRTDFWDNVVARQKDDHYELAYGHHRIEAVRQCLGSEAKVHLIVRDLDDSDMLKIMAADNDEAYNVTPGFILEVVAATKSFISNRYNSPKLVGVKLCKDGETTLCHRIHTQLDWPRHRVEDALAQLNAIEQGDLSRKAVESLPSQHAAATLHREVQKAKSLGKPLTQKAQVRFAKRAATEDKKGAARVIQQEAAFHARPIREDSQRVKELNDFIGKVAKHAHNLSKELETLVEFRNDLNSDIYRDTLESRYLRSVLAEVKAGMAPLEAESPGPSKPEKDLLAG